MSVEEEVELRDLVAQTLELNGCLPQIRAQLRANVFLALDEDSKISKQQPLQNKKLKSYSQAPEGQMMFCLVREFLEYFDLDFTASVYEPESCMGSYYKYEGRQKIIEGLGLKSEEVSGPVLLQVIKIAQMKSKTLRINLRDINGDEQKESIDSSSVSLVQVNGHSLSEIEENSLVDKSCRKSEEPLNVTHVVKKNNSSKENGGKLDVENNLDSTYVKKDVENDDTFNGTSSIEEEMANGFENSADVSEKSLLNDDDNVNSTDNSSEPKSKSEDRIKSHKSEKLKSKLELPPLQLNKSRGSDILPSLYNKDFKEKTNRDYDFEIKDDYEEDFMSGSEREFSHSKSDSPKPLFEELQQCSEYTTNAISISSKNKNSFHVNKQNQNSHSDNKFTNSSSTDNETNSSVDEENKTNSNNLNTEGNT